MADTIISPARSGSRVMAKILQRLARGASQTTEADKMSNLSLNRLKRRCWVISDADPEVSPASYLDAPVLKGDFVLRIDSDEAFICSAAPTDAATAVFIQLHT